MHRDSSGQTIAAILLIVTLALIVGTGVTARFVTNLRTRVSTDFSYRADGAAQALAERILLKDFQTLKDYITYNNCGTNCSLSISQSGINSAATASLSYVGNSPSPYEVSVKTTEGAEVSLLGYGDNKNLNVCWNNLANGIKPSVIALYVSGAVGSYQADTYAVNASGSSYSSNGFTSATPNFGYSNCFTVTGKTAPQFIRLRSVYADFNAYVRPLAGSNIPSQGIKITSTGTSGTATRKVVVTKSDTFLPVDFEYSLFQTSTDETLTNVQSVTP
jgi:hypothetical protein